MRTEVVIVLCWLTFLFGFWIGFRYAGRISQPKTIRIDVTPDASWTYNDPKYFATKRDFV